MFVCMFSTFVYICMLICTVYCNSILAYQIVPKFVSQARHGTRFCVSINQGNSSKVQNNRGQMFVIINIWPLLFWTFEPLLRTHCLFKFEFGTESSHLYNIKDVRYRSAITKLRVCSHILEIEHGRYIKPKVVSHLRLCKLCNIVEDEEHFVTECVVNTGEQLHLLERIHSIYPDVNSLEKRQMFVFLMGSAGAQL